MTAPLPTSAQRIRQNADHLVEAAQMAASWDVPVEAMFVTPDYVQVHVCSVEGGRQLARVLDLFAEDVDTHPHGTGIKVAVRWSRPDSPLAVVTVQQADSIGQVA